MSTGPAETLRSMSFHTADLPRARLIIARSLARVRVELTASNFLKVSGLPVAYLAVGRRGIRTLSISPSKGEWSAIAYPPARRRPGSPRAPRLNPQSCPSTGSPRRRLGRVGVEPTARQPLKLAGLPIAYLPQAEGGRIELPPALRPERFSKPSRQTSMRLPSERRVRDSNPHGPFGTAGFQDQCSAN